MNERKPMDKEQARERRNRLLENAAAARLSLVEGVCEMRAIAGMTQAEFAQHRGVSVGAIKAVERGDGNPTVATLNRIGQFFGLEVAFVQTRRLAPSMKPLQPSDTTCGLEAKVLSELIGPAKRPTVENLIAAQEIIMGDMRRLSDMLEMHVDNGKKPG